MSWARIVLLLGLPACVEVGDGSKSEDTGTDGSGFVPDGTGPSDPDADLDGYAASVDCDDANAAINPGAVEACDGIDNNCDDLMDDQYAATVLGGATYETVDEALSAALLAPDASVAVCPGTFTVAPVTLELGSLAIHGVAGRDATTLASAAGGSIVSIDAGASLTIDGLTLTGANGPAVVVLGDSVATVTSSRLTANGQGLYVLGEDRQGGDIVGATVVVENVEFLGNVGGANGGGAGFEGAFSASIRHSTFTDNAGANGGGLYLATLFGPAEVAIGDVQIVGNVAAGDGGGVYTQLVSFVGDATTQIVGNSAAAHGGGIASLRGTVSSVLVSGNDAAFGGGLAAVHDPLFSTAPNAGEAEGLIVDGNSATEGGGLWIGAGEFVSLRSSSKVTLNTAAVRGGGMMLGGDDAWVSSDFADFGEPGVDDNAPEDLFVDGFGSLFFGNDEAFLCSTVAFCE